MAASVGPSQYGLLVSTAYWSGAQPMRQGWNA
jgi:hypothetical protein